MEIYGGMYVCLVILMSTCCGIYVQSSDELRENVYRIINLTPSQMEYGTSKCLTLNFERLPETVETYVCEFEILSSIQFTMANRAQNGTILCQTPHPHSLPSINHDQHTILSKLSIRSSKAVIASTNFTFYDCLALKSCTECVSSPYPCNFCIEGNLCTDDVQKCTNDVLIGGKFSPGHRQGPDFCPKILSTNSETEIVLPSGMKKRIVVKAKVDMGYVIQSRFLCRFDIENNPITVNAQLLGDTIYCEQIQLNLEGNTTEMTVPLSVLFHGNKALDNPENIHILLYSCHQMADDCEKCLNLKEKYSCGYCQGSNASCTLRDDCTTTFLRQKDTCPKMSIIVRDLKPRNGPISGGTSILIYGKGFGQGKVAKVLLGDAECKIIRRTTDEIQCVTGPATAQGSVHIRVEIDGVGHAEKSTLTFQYVTDPMIDGLKSDYSRNALPKGIVSGGTINVFRGDNLNFLNSTKFFVTYKNIKYESNCFVKSESELWCESPSVLNLMGEDIDQESPLLLEYGFITGGPRLVNNLHSNGSSAKFLMYPDPSLERFDGLRLFISDYLTINGKQLDPAIKETDVNIRFGNSDCLLTSISRSQLTCRAKFPSDSSHSLFNVTVRIGSLLFPIGQLARVQEDNLPKC